MTPMPEVAEVEVPPPPIAGPSRVSHSPLFAEEVGLGDEHIGMGAPTSSDECCLCLLLPFTEFGSLSVWHASPAEAQG